MEATLSIKEYMAWTWYTISRYIDVRKEYKKLSDIPEKFLPRSVFVNENEFIESIKICGSVCSGEGIDNSPRIKDIDIKWLDDFDYQAKLEVHVKEDGISQLPFDIWKIGLIIAGFIVISYYFASWVLSFKQ
jgi:hypothetical protein